MPGPFDRRPAANANAKGKLVLATLLAVTLAGVLGYHFMHHAPATASAASFNSPGPVPAVSPADALARLADDPTVHLLRGGAEPPSALDHAPHDPFQMSADWRKTLVKPEQPKTIAQVVQVPVEPVTPQAAPQIKPHLPPFDASTVKLQGVFRTNGRTYALINGSIAETGQTVANARIMDVLEDRLVLQPLGAPDTMRVEILLKPR